LLSPDTVDLTIQLIKNFYKLSFFYKNNEFKINEERDKNDKQ